MITEADENNIFVYTKDTNNFDQLKICYKIIFKNEKYELYNHIFKCINVTETINIVNIKYQHKISIIEIFQ